MSTLLYGWLLLKASLFSTSGSGNIPIVYAEFVPRGWATDGQFAQSLAIGQISPGPTGLWVISFGYLTYGLRGAFLALVGITLPPLFVLVVDSLYRRIGAHPAVEGFVRGLSLAVVGVFLVVVARLLWSTGLDARSIFIAVASLCLGLTRRVPVVLVLVLAAVLGIVLR